MYVDIDSATGGGAGGVRLKSEAWWMGSAIYKCLSAWADLSASFCPLPLHDLQAR